MKKRTGVAAPESPRGRGYLTWFACVVVFVLGTTAFSALPGAIVQQSSGAVGALTLGTFSERELAGGQTDGYQISLAAGQYLQISVEQRSSNVAVTLLGPDGKALAEADYDDDIHGQEMLSLVATAACHCQLQVRSKMKTPGRYLLKVEALREATSQDPDRVIAWRLRMEGKKLSSMETAEGRRGGMEKYEAALSAWKALGDRVGEATTLCDLGDLYYILSNPQKAFEAYNQALALWRAEGRRLEEGQTLSSLGLISYLREERQKAIEQYLQALPIIRESGDRFGEGETLNRIGWAYNAMDEREKAIAHFNLALPLRRSSGDRSGEAVTLNDLGRAYDLLGKKQQAIEFYEQALKAVSPEEEPGNVANILNRLGIVYESMSDSQQALDTYGRALKLSETLNSPRTEAGILNNIGRVYTNLGDYDRALDYYDRSLQQCREAKILSGEATVINNLGQVYQALGDLPKAIDQYRQALTLNETLGNRGGQAASLQALASVSNQMGDSRRAIGMLEQALAIRRTIGDRRGEASAINELGNAWALTGDAPRAHEYFSQALPIQRAVGNREGEANTLLGLASAKYKLGETDGARALLDQSLDLTESIRAKVLGSELRNSYFARAQRQYERSIELSMQMHLEHRAEGQDRVALQISERARARGLLDLLSEARADIRSGISPSLREREQELRQQLNTQAAAQARLMSGKYQETQAAALALEITKLTEQLGETEAEIRRGSPRYAALTQPEPLTVADLQGRLLDPETLLLEYALQDQNSYLWAVTPTTFHSYRLPPRAEIEAAAREVYELITARQKHGVPPDQRLKTRAEALSRVLLGPVASQLGSKRLLIVAPGVLSYLPFAALPAPPGADQPARGRGRRPSLIAQHEIVSLPSASVLATIRREAEGRPRATGSIAVLADPVFDATDSRLAIARRSKVSDDAPPAPSPVPAIPAEEMALKQALRGPDDSNARARLARLFFTRQEAESIFSLASAKTGLKATDFDASRALVMSEQLSQYRILHFATHGLLNSAHPELSGLVFSLFDREGRPQDGFLRLHDIYNLRLNADLVVLSACQTGLGKEVRGEGLIGLTRGFIYAGAPRVVASLWKVDDLATAELMKLFYEGLFKEARPPAAALRKAQYELSQQKQWASPYFWAGFVLHGEWR